MALDPFFSSSFLCCILHLLLPARSGLLNTRRIILLASHWRYSQTDPAFQMTPYAVLPLSTNFRHFPFVRLLIRERSQAQIGLNWSPPRYFFFSIEENVLPRFTSGKLICSPFFPEVRA